MMRIYTPLDRELADPDAWWIDRDGKVLAFAGHDRLSDPLGENRLSLHFTHFGLVKLMRRGRVVEMQWDVDSCNLEAFDTALNLLMEQPLCRAIKLRFFKTGWSVDLVQNAQAAVDRAQQLRKYRGVPVLARTIMRELSPAEVEKRDALLAKAMAEWRERRALESPYLIDRTLRFGRDNDGTCFRFEHVGAKTALRKVAGNEICDDLVGKPADDSFDRDFESRIASDYEACWQDREPRYQHVRALIDVAGDKKWISFQRLLLPCQDKLDVVAHLTDDVDIPGLFEDDLGAT